MAGITKSVCMALLAAVLLVNAIQPAQAVIGCGTVTTSLMPCIPYVSNKDPRPSGSCCNGIKGLYTAAKTKQDHQSVCNCLKAVANSHSSINYGRAATVPRLCGVRIPYKISPSIDCNRVQ